PDATPAGLETMARVRPYGYAAAAWMLSAADILADIAAYRWACRSRSSRRQRYGHNAGEQPRDRRALSVRAVPPDPQGGSRALSGKAAGVQPTDPRSDDAAHWVDWCARSNRLTRHVFKVVR